MLACKGSQIEIKIIDVQRQKGTCDCGLFAVAFSTALANGIQPERLEFEQDRMRKHLYSCFNQDALCMFPASRREPQATVQSTDIIEIYCTCRMPEMPPMVECFHCSEWYHTDCVHVPKIALDDTSVEWFCCNCLP